MVLPRASIPWGAFRNQTVRTARVPVRTELWRQVQRRGYASGGDHGATKSSDLPWLIGAIVVTVPTCAFLLQPNPDKGHGHHDPDHEGRGHQEHAEDDATSTDGDDSEPEGDEKVETQSSDERSGSDEEEGTTDDSSKSEESSGEGEEQQNTPDTSEDEEPENETQIKGGGGDVEGVQFKGATKDGQAGDTRKSYPDSKGGYKKRIESNYGMKQGEDPEGQTTVDGKTRDKPAPSKPEGSQNTISGKQAGLTNTDTKHSTDIAGNPEKSSKSDGSPETAKAKGTVDPRD